MRTTNINVNHEMKKFEFNISVNQAINVLCKNFAEHKDRKKINDLLLDAKELI